MGGLIIALVFGYSQLGHPAIMGDRQMMNGRLIVAIVTVALQETAIAVIVLWGLPRLGINIPVAGLVAIMAAWIAFTVTIYRKGSHALRRKQVSGLTDMLGSTGEVTHRLVPGGYIKIRGELWQAVSHDHSTIEIGRKVTVVRQQGLKLVVREAAE